MTGVCDCCGAPRQKRVERGSLSAIDEPYTLFSGSVPIKLSRFEARISYELVRFGRISSERIFTLSPSAEEGNCDRLPSVMIFRIRRKLEAAGATAEISTCRGWGYELVEK